MSKKTLIVCLCLLFCGSVFGEEPCEVPTASDYASASRELIDSPQGFWETSANFFTISSRAKINRYEQCLKQQEADLRRERLKAEAELLRAETEAIKAETEALKAETEALKNDTRKPSTRKLSGDADYQIDLGLVLDFEDTRKLIEQCAHLGRLEVLRSTLESATDLEQLRATLESYGVEPYRIVGFRGCPSGMSGTGIVELIEAPKPSPLNEDDFGFIPDSQPETETLKPKDDFGFIPLYFGIGEGHWISDNMDGGHLIKLEDGSLWEISLVDRVGTVLWLVTEEITVTKDGNAVYPYRLINTDTGDVAEAKLLSQ